MIQREWNILLTTAVVLLFNLISVIEYSLYNFTWFILIVILWIVLPFMFECKIHSVLHKSAITQQVPLLLSKNRKLRVQLGQTNQNWTIEDWQKSVTWSDEFLFLMWHSEGGIRIWCKQHKSMDSSCLLSTVQASTG